MAKRRWPKHRREGQKRLEGQRGVLEPAIQLPTDWQPPAAWLEDDAEGVDHGCSA